MKSYLWTMLLGAICLSVVLAAVGSAAEADENATLEFAAKDARVKGDAEFVDKRGGFVGRWYGDDVVLTWRKTRIAAGTYKVSLVYSSDKGEGRISISAGKGELEADIEPTGSWGKVEEVPLGNLVVERDTWRLKLETLSLNARKGALMDLRMIVLERIASETNP